MDVVLTVVLAVAFASLSKIACFFAASMSTIVFNFAAALSSAACSDMFISF